MMRVIIYEIANEPTNTIAISRERLDNGLAVKYGKKI